MTVSVTVSALLWALVGGAVVGLLGKWVGPGDHEEVPLWLTVLGGIAGVLVGTVLHALLFTTHPVGTDWWRHVWQIVTAVLVVGALAAVAGRPHHPDAGTRDPDRRSGARSRRGA